MKSQQAKIAAATRTQADRQRAVDEVNEGATQASVARKYGVSPKAISLWAAKLEKKQRTVERAVDEVREMAGLKKARPKKLFLTLDGLREHIAKLDAEKTKAAPVETKLNDVAPAWTVTAEPVGVDRTHRAMLTTPKHDDESATTVTAIERTNDNIINELQRLRKENARLRRLLADFILGEP